MKAIGLIIDSSDNARLHTRARMAYGDVTQWIVLFRKEPDKLQKIGNVDYVFINDRRIEPDSRYTLFVSVDVSMGQEHVQAQVRDAMRVGVFDARNHSHTIEVFSFDGTCLESLALVD